jgi:hypothetical protein
MPSLPKNMTFVDTPVNSRPSLFGIDSVQKSLPKNMTFVDTPVNSRPSLFGIDSVHQMETYLSHALLVY